MSAPASHVGRPRPRGYDPSPSPTAPRRGGLRPSRSRRTTRLYTDGGADRLAARGGRAVGLLHVRGPPSCAPTRTEASDGGAPFHFALVGNDGEDHYDRPDPGRGRPLNRSRPSRTWPTARPRRSAAGRRPSTWRPTRRSRGSTCPGRHRVGRLVGAARRSLGRPRVRRRRGRPARRQLAHRRGDHHPARSARATRPWSPAAVDYQRATGSVSSTSASGRRGADPSGRLRVRPALSRRSLRQGP